MIRLLDLLFALTGLMLLSPLLLLVTVIGFFDTRSPFFLQQRVGRYQRPFTLVKFRTMRTSTPDVATHEVSRQAITPVGSLLRRTKLDELPQLLNVLTGSMSLVGPRPCLPSQTELVAERDSRGVFNVRPGITGLAQVREIDMSTPQLLAETDAEMITSLTTGRYLALVLATAFGKGSGDRVRE